MMSEQTASDRKQVVISVIGAIGVGFVIIAQIFGVDVDTDPVCPPCPEVTVECDDDTLDPVTTPEPVAE
jgi:hypothetical protein